MSAILTRNELIVQFGDNVEFKDGYAISNNYLDRFDEVCWRLWVKSGDGYITKQVQFLPRGESHSLSYDNNLF